VAEGVQYNRSEFAWWETPNLLALFLRAHYRKQVCFSLSSRTGPTTAVVGSFLLVVETRHDPEEFAYSSKRHTSRACR
jgi:hypothetical protein